LWIFVRNPEITKKLVGLYGSSEKIRQQPKWIPAIGPKTDGMNVNPIKWKSKKNDSIHTVDVCCLWSFHHFHLGFCASLTRKSTGHASEAAVVRTLSITQKSPIRPYPSL